jgi:hypothetical protein
MAALDRAGILSANDLKVHSIAVPEWGGDVFVKSLTGAERESFESAIGTPGVRSTRALLVFHTACDEKGERLFVDTEDVAKLEKRSSAALDRVASEAMRINRMGSKALEEAEKNLPAAPSGASPSV